MNFVFPWGLAWLASVPVLVWLWRYAASKHQIRVSSLVPFAHLLRRTPIHRRRVHVNWLFWLQLACLVLIALALAEPALIGRPTKTLLLILDTSASMQARHHSSPLLSAAKARLLQRVNRMGPRERALLMTTAPMRAVTPEPTTDRFALQQLIHALSASDMGGRLASAAQLGHVLLGAVPDETVVATDEPVPEPLDPSVHVHSVGEPLPNVAIIGVEAYEPLCASATVIEAPHDQAHVLVTVQNFSKEAQEITVEVRQRNRLLTEQRQHLEAGQRLPLSLFVPGAGEDIAQVRVSAPHDALDVDNQAWVGLHGSRPLSVVVSSEHDAFVDTVGRWLDACPRIQWRRQSGPADAVAASELLITDQMSQAQAWPSSALVYSTRTPRAQATLTHWFNDTPHVLTTYLSVLEPVSTALTPFTVPASGEPVLWALSQGRRVPLVVAEQREGRRLVQCAMDPTATPSSLPVIVLFFNSLRWLSGSSALAMTGEPLMAGPLAPGPVRIERPDGATERRMHEDGVVRYDATDRVGVYRFVQGATALERAVNFFDPVESNTQARRSTWAVEETLPSSAPKGTAQRLPAPSRGRGGETGPLIHWLLSAVLALLVIEWLMYQRRGRS